MTANLDYGDTTDFANATRGLVARFDPRRSPPPMGA